MAENTSSNRTGDFSDLTAANEHIRELEARLTDEHRRRRVAEDNDRCFRELAEHIREVIWMTDSSGEELVYVCPAFEQIWGLTCDDVYQQPQRRLARVHEADRQRVFEAFERDARRGCYDETYRIERPDGEIRWIRDRAYPVLDDDGEVYRLAGLALDITARIEFNDHIANLHTRIDTRDRMSVFAALGTGLAHDLSQPLTAARNFIGRARIGFMQDPDQLRDTLMRADSEIKRAISIVHHMRDFARQGRPTVREQPLQPIIDDVHQLMDPMLRGNNVRYNGPDDAALAELKLPVDEIFVQQILRNLLTNSSQSFAPRDHGVRSIWLDIGDAGVDYVDIEIGDNGTGIENDVDVFEPFITTKDEGVGLGLAVSRTLARSHGGDLFVKSRGRASAGDAERTIFVLRLPRRSVGESRKTTGVDASRA